MINIPLSNINAISCTPCCFNGELATRGSSESVKRDKCLKVMGNPSTTAGLRGGCIGYIDTQVLSWR